MTFDNQAACVEHNIHTGLPANLHSWWSRKPLGVARAIIFSSLVDDPAEYLEGQDAVARREELFSLVSDLADVKNNANAELFERARREILRSNDGAMPRFWDPFCGGGSLPLEALRLGLPSIGSDSNPVAAFLTRIMIDLAPQQAFHPAINSMRDSALLEDDTRFAGLKSDVASYGQEVFTRASRELGGCYPDASVPSDQGARSGKVVAWIWARSVVCPNPSCRAQSPLVNKFVLSTHRGNEAHVVPTYNQNSRTFRFAVATTGTPSEGTVTRTGAICLACGHPISFDHIRSEGVAGRISHSLMAMAVEGERGRVYLGPDDTHVAAARDCTPDWEPDSDMPDSALGFRVQRYGLTKHRDLFTKRQMTALSCLARTIEGLRPDIIRDAGGDADYADLVQAFLALSLSRLAQTNNTLVRWLVRTSGTSKGTPALDRQIVSMVWEFSEGNVFGESVGSWRAALRNPLTALDSIPASGLPCRAFIHDAASDWDSGGDCVVSTDPPYFDAIGYADLSDFFYIWLRKCVGSVFPDLFATLLVPKSPDMTRDLGRREVPRATSTKQFLERLHGAFEAMRRAASEEVPLTVYYAFKQTEAEAPGSDGKSRTATGWETLLEGLIRAQFQITGTWPLRTESASRLRAIGSNALASSIVLVCRPRPTNALITTRRDFILALKSELPSALANLRSGNIAPVDLAQAAIGPGMAVYTRFAQVLDTQGDTLPVRDALALINECLDEALIEQEGDFDVDTRWALTWFEQFRHTEGPFGVAEQLSKSKNTSVAGLVEAGLIETRRGSVRLLQPQELSDEWDPRTDDRLTAWEVTHHLVRMLAGGGESAAAGLARALGASSEVGRELAYRLFVVCERNGWAQEALVYNALVVAWPQIQRLAAAEPAAAGPSQTSFEV